MNCVEVNQLGCTPFFALFGRDPVGLAELSWPDLEHLDVDGNDFITGLADKLRTIWGNLKTESDRSKANTAARANQARQEVTPEPLKAGDYVWVEYGDTNHSHRLGKAGLKRRRRFKVIQHYPERGYVQIDPDGVRIDDKVPTGTLSAHR